MVLQPPQARVVPERAITLTVDAADDENLALLTQN
jgi:hypothetical protein